VHDHGYGRGQSQGRADHVAAGNNHAVDKIMKSVADNIIYGQGMGVLL